MRTWTLPLPVLIAALACGACGGGSSSGGGSSGGGGGSAAPVVSFISNPASTTPGGNITLTWSSSNATSCAASGGWSGNKPTTGSELQSNLTMTTTYLLDCTGAGGTTRATAVVSIAAAAGRFPLAVSADQRHLQDPTGRQFLVNGDTPWSLMVGLTDAEVTQYLDDRQGRGFNAILVNLIEHQFASDPPRNVLGVAPFRTAEDIRTPNDAYFNRAADIVQQARDREILVLMTPAYLGYNGGTEGWWTALSQRTTAEVQAYGVYLGARFASLPNIIWVMGGDYWDPQVLTRTRALVTGLKSAGRADWLFTYHANSNFSSASVVGGESWLDVNATYAYETPGPAAQLEQDYDRTPTRPSILLESRYEQEPNPPVSRLSLRSQAYWSLLAGGVGAMFGNNPIWNFGNRALFAYSGTWQSNLGSNGAQDRTRFNNFFSGTLDWSLLVPDRTDAILTSGQGSGADTAYAAKAVDSSFVLVYTPSQKQLTINMASVAGPNVESRWFAPDSGALTVIGTFPGTGSRSFTPPAAGDWVLVLRSVP